CTTKLHLADQTDSTYYNQTNLPLFINMHPRFTGQVNDAFLGILRNKIAAYFESTNRSRYGDGYMFIKSILMFLLYFTPYVVLMTGYVTHPLFFILNWVVIGFGMSGIGLSVMHDANHQSYSSRRWVNKV